VDIKKNQNMHNKTFPHNQPLLGGAISSHKFDKSMRLLTTRDYRRVMQNGLKSVSRYFVILAIPSSRQRVGIIVSKKVAKSAVLRNKAKRRIREIYRTMSLGSQRLAGYTTQSRLNNQDTAMEIVIIARRRILETSSDVLTHDLCAMIKRISQHHHKNKAPIRKANTIHIESRTSYLNESSKVSERR